MALRQILNPLARLSALTRASALARPSAAFCTNVSPPGSAKSSSRSDRHPSPATHRVMFSLMGKDRVGIVKDFTGLVRKYGGNVEGSRMIQLGGEFAMIVCVRLGEGKKGLLEALDDGFDGYTVGFRDVRDPEDPKKSGGLWYMELEGPDAEGIVAAVTETLVVHGGTITEMETDTTTAPFAGFPLFKLESKIRLHDGNYESVSRSFNNIENRFGCNIIFKQADEV